MENKKPIIIGVVALLILAAGWMLVGKFKDLKSAKNVNPPVSDKTQKNDSVTTKESVVTRGVVTDFTSDSLTLKTETGETIIENTPETTIYMLDETGLPVETKITDLKKDAKALVVHEESVTREKVFVSSIIQGAVTAITDGKISIQTIDEGTKVVDITASPTIYMGDGDQAVDMQVSDIKIGSEITVAYADAETKLQVVSIRIDKL